MSIRLMSQVWEDARIQSQAELLVLLALADHARDDGLCWLSIRTIATKARIEERSAQRILRRGVRPDRRDRLRNSGFSSFAT
jgi:hypothetical protein